MRDHVVRRVRIANLAFASVFALFAVWCATVFVLAVVDVATGSVSSRHAHGSPRVWVGMIGIVALGFVSALVARRMVDRRARLRSKLIVAALAGALLEETVRDGDRVSVSVAACLFVLALVAVALDWRLPRQTRSGIEARES